MITRSSRYRLEDVYTSKDPVRADHDIAGVQPHRADALEVRRKHLVAGHQRLDTLAQTYYADPLLFWLICDANETIFPDDLMVPGRVLRIPRNKR